MSGASGLFAVIPVGKFGRLTSFVIGALSLVMCLETAVSRAQQDDSPPAPATESDQPAAAETSDDNKVRQELLPEGFVPAADRLPEVTIEDPKMTSEEEVETLRSLRQDKFSSVIRDGVLNKQSEQILQRAAAYYVNRLSMPSHRKELKKMTDDVLLSIRTAGKSQSNPATRRTFRRFYLQEITDRTTELFKGNLFVRVDAAVILGGLILVPKDSANPNDVAFGPALKPLLDVVVDANQPDAVKIPAVNGIGQVVATAGLDTLTKMDAAAALINQFDDPKVDAWYQEVLIKTVASIDVALDRDNKPFIVVACVEAMSDSKRPWLVRATAAKSLGRATIDTERVNLEALAYVIAEFTRDMTAAYNKNPKTFPLARSCFWNAYLAFKPDSTENAGQAGLLRFATPIIQGAYQQVVPLARAVLSVRRGEKRAPLDDAQLVEWLQKNKPMNQRVATSQSE